MASRREMVVCRSRSGDDVVDGGDVLERVPGDGQDVGVLACLDGPGGVGELAHLGRATSLTSGAIMPRRQSGVRIGALAAIASLRYQGDQPNAECQSVCRSVSTGGSQISSATSMTRRSGRTSPVPTHTNVVQPAVTRVVADVGEPAHDLASRWIGATVATALELCAIFGGDHPVEVRTERAITAMTRMVGALHRPTDASFASPISEEQVLALGSLGGQGDAPSVRVVEHRVVQRLETHSLSSTPRVVTEWNRGTAMARRADGCWPCAVPCRCRREGWR
jgi:hypothetical protein